VKNILQELIDRDLDYADTGEKAFIVDIDPEMAQRLLNNNFKQNRELSQAHIKALATDMKNGEWALTNDAIVVSQDLETGNAQHRLHAIIESKTTQRFLVLFGVAKETFQKFDTGKKRTMEQRITIGGTNISGKECSVIRHSMNAYTHPQIGTVEFGYPKHDEFVAAAYLKHKEFLTLTNSKSRKGSSFYWAAALKMYAEMIHYKPRNGFQHDHDPLTRAQLFIDICTKNCSNVGIPVGPSEIAAIRLNNLRVARRLDNNTLYWSDKKALRLTIVAAYKFMLGENVQKLMISKQDPFHSFLHMPSTNSSGYATSNQHN